MADDDKYILPIQDIGELSGHEQHAAKQILQFLIDKFTIQQIAEILKRIGQQFLHYTQQRLELDADAKRETELMRAQGRGLDLAAGSGIIVDRRRKTNGESETK